MGRSRGWFERLIDTLLSAPALRAIELLGVSRRAASNHAKQGQRKQRTASRHLRAPAFARHAWYEPLEARRLLAIEVELVRDINLTSADSNPSNITPVGSVVFFTANDGLHGRELWKSDGTASGTALVKDIEPGTFGFQPNFLASVGGTLYFSAGGRLWTSDGTPTGTVVVKDVAPSSSSSGFTIVGGAVYFVANDGVNGNELWKSDVLPQRELELSSLVVSEC